ncbi:ankyrin repeat and SAM domain-containing protein 6-like [Macadamia integrifolia]|uniref:ankyrin repeat and SAM domain-containing protein 6-like n=1 Tax=Macadamia integrifolia TaxID=60698 RepID=UPI001C4EB6D7|nr:ankyrin repeat and SAM domain-containing protein 6-like [Macadamia integrifolia]XP_042515021.1 ankyrin repeat and SAM domain-containing protein 6-like [Macadamia integrifolia]XP_042515022.1 ankyrin repeat and SAM domain-containing protein 6-like [Macadamia integrifolia]XP_042515023.1 ankyrin repeat and SAM domain-containing protein 6-like [Macadamia integrifolia]
MYADRVAAGTERSVKERLNGNTVEDFGRSRQINNKRRRPNDDKWEHDLFEDEEEPRVTNHKVGSSDLRLKLQKKNSLQVYQSGKGTNAGGVRDLREKLSGTMHSQPANYVPPKLKSALELVKPARKSVLVEAPAPETKNVSNSTSSRKKTQQKDGKSVEGLLQSLGLEKYQIIFKAEEVDMTALMHMTDEDLKALGVPMGPRKKILLALDSQA